MNSYEQFEQQPIGVPMPQAGEEFEDSGSDADEATQLSLPSEMDAFLREHKTDPESAKAAWLQAAKEGVPIEDNFEMVRALETLAPGAVAYLQSEFNIQHFGRYPLNLLLEMYEERSEIRQAGVIIYAKHDHNDALYNQLPIQELHATVKGVCSVKVVECGSVEEVAHALEKLRNRHGLLAFAAVYAHGTEHQITFGENRESGTLNQGSVHEALSETLRTTLVQGAQICLASCSTGAKNGIGERIAEAGGRDTYAPTHPTAMRSFGVKVSGNRISFSPEYFDARAAHLKAA